MLCDASSPYPPLPLLPYASPSVTCARPIAGPAKRQRSTPVGEDGLALLLRLALLLSTEISISPEFDPAQFDDAIDGSIDQMLGQMLQPMIDQIDAGASRQVVARPVTSRQATSNSRVHPTSRVHRSHSGVTSTKVGW